jgi:uncharacterized membrane protein YdjX (TVP38/TMEM64 family)
MMTTVPKSTEPAAPLFSFSRLWPLLALAVVLGAFFALGLDKYLSFEQLREHRGELKAFVETQPVWALLGFVAAYAVVAAFSLPIAALVSITGGFLFGSFLGCAANVAGAGIGATAVFLAAQTVFGESLRSRAGPFVARMEAGFRENALSYLLSLRLIPLFPFVLVNIVPAVLGVPLRTYLIGTFLGIIPGCFVFASIGAGLGSVFDSGKEFSLKGALTPEVIIALVGLAVLSLLPVVYKQITKKRA